AASHRPGGSSRGFPGAAVSAFASGSDRAALSRRPSTPPRRRDIWRHVLGKYWHALLDSRSAVHLTGVSSGSFGCEVAVAHRGGGALFDLYAGPLSPLLRSRCISHRKRAREGRPANSA